MFVLILGRHNEAHIVDYKNIQGKYRTLCDKNFHQNQSITTLGADNTFNGICPICKKNYDEMYISDLNDDVRIARSMPYNHSSVLSFHRHDFMGPKANYEPVWGRAWTKLSRARSVSKNKNYKYYGK